MNNLLKSLICCVVILGFYTSASAQACQNIFDRAIAMVTETQERSRDVDDRYFNHCAKNYIEDQKSKGRSISVSGNYGAIGGSYGSSKQDQQLRIELNEECRLDDTKKRSSGDFRNFVQQLQPEYFYAYEACLKAQGPIIMSMENGATVRDMVLSLASRQKKDLVINSMFIQGDKNLVCKEVTSDTNINNLSYPIDISDVNFAVKCSHGPASKDGDVYDYKGASFHMTTDNAAAQQLAFKFPESRVLTGRSLVSLENEIKNLKEQLSASNERIEGNNASIEVINSKPEILAFFVVHQGQLQRSTPGVSYNSGVITFPNPDKLSFVPVISSLKESHVDYLTTMHYVNSAKVSDNSFKVWRTTLDTGARHAAPTSFVGTVIGNKG